MRVAMVTGSDYPPTDGIGIYSLNLAQHLAALGHSVAIITRGGLLPNTRTLDGLEIVRLPFIPAYPFHVHAHGIFVNRYLEKHRGRFDIFHAHSPLVPVLTSVKPVVTTFHAPVTEHRVSRIDDTLSLLTHLQVLVSAKLERKLLERSHSIAVVNPQLAAQVALTFGRRVPVRVMANGVDIQRFVPSPRARERDVVLAVGRLQHGKGFEDLLAAWPQVLRRRVHAKLRIVGGGPLLERLRTLATRLGILESVAFMGPISQTESSALLSLYQRAAVVVQPSHHEGISTVILEAMAVGVPVVATDVGGHATVIEQGVDGVLVPPADVVALSEAIATVLEDDAHNEMGAKAREKVVKSYSWMRIAEAHEGWYASVLHGESDPS